MVGRATLSGKSVILILIMQMQRTLSDLLFTLAYTNDSRLDLECMNKRAGAIRRTRTLTQIFLCTHNVEDGTN